jgi:bifunctional DNase/RNase
MVMSEMYVSGITLDPRNKQPILVLNDADRRRALPIWIGYAEATSIGMALAEETVDRPMTHDLLMNVIENLGFDVEKVEINDSIDGAFLASITLTFKRSREFRQVIDARPSDAVALALRAHAPIFVSPEVFAEGTISLDEEADAKEKQDFLNFIDNINASDFIMPTGQSDAA